MTKWKLIFLVATAALLVAQTSRPSARKVDATALRNAAANGDEWITYGRDYAETRFSPLKQIDASNVAKLGLAWSYDTESVRGLEATPLISNGIMYTTGPWSVVYAVDARTGAFKWKHDPEVPRSFGQKACCDVVNRGVALYDGKVYVGTIDGRLQALDASTGKLIWTAQTTDRNTPLTITGAPRVIKGKVIIGNGGSELGVRGYVSAWDAATGKQAWRFYIVPGDPSKPFEDEAQAAAAKTWTGEWWKMGGGGSTLGRHCLRPRRRPSLCRHRQRLPLGTTHPQPQRRRQPLSQLHHCPQARHRQTSLALPDHARRNVGLHRRPANHPRRPQHQRPR